MNAENSESRSLEFIPEVTDWTGAVRGMFANCPNPPYVEEAVRLFDDKPRDYTDPARYAETEYSFYDRSSLDEVERTRQMLQRWVDRMPLKKQKDIVSRMRHEGFGSITKEDKFEGAFFELFLHEFLNGTGGYTVVEPKIGRRTPDFGVTETGRDGNKINYVVEATNLNVQFAQDLEWSWNENKAFDILNEIKTADFRLWVRTKGTLASMPSKKGLKRPFEELARDADYDKLTAVYDLYGPAHMPEATFAHEGWRITGQLIPVTPERRPRKGRFIGMIGPGIWGTFNDIEKTRKALSKKADRYKNIDNLIVAVRGDPFLERMGDVLFGRQVYQVYVPKPNHTGPIPPSHYAQKYDGFWFNTYGPKNQNVMGVLAFFKLHPGSVDKAGAVFYANPYTEKPLPAWASKITHAEYREDGVVSVVEGVPPGFFVKDHEPYQDYWETPR